MDVSSVRRVINPPNRSLQNLQTVEAEKISVGYDRTPARVGVAFENGESNLSDFARVLRRRACVVYDPVRSALRVNARAPQVNHHVVRILLNPRLVEEEQIAGPRFAPVAADEGAVEIFERARVCELGERSVREVRLGERSGGGAEELFADGASLQSVRAHIGRDRVVSLAHTKEPRAVVRAQGLAPSEAH